jgi:two-component system, cell cycle sensor histidine kinase and response regulator CckA
MDFRERFVDTLSTTVAALEWNAAVGPMASLTENATGKCDGTILYVEDEAFVREVTREVLQAAGYCVLAAKDAAEAIALYQEHCGGIDLLLTDVVLPGENGRELAARLKRRNERLKVILASGYGEQMADEGTPNECLPKPFSSEVLLQRVGELLGSTTGSTKGLTTADSFRHAGAGAQLSGFASES